MPCQFPTIKNLGGARRLVYWRHTFYTSFPGSLISPPQGVGETKYLENEVVHFALDSAENTSSWNPLSYHTMFRPLFLWEKGQHSHKWNFRLSKSLLWSETDQFTVEQMSTHLKIDHFSSQLNLEKLASDKLWFEESIKIILTEFRERFVVQTFNFVNLKF